jgi:multiple sugar transport system substrate-binding protein
MDKRIWTVATLIAGLALSAVPATAEELTILWADWDPANYLQELANLYAAETGVIVKVETTPWPDFQTKAFLEFNAHSDAYDLVVGDSQWVGTGATQGHYVELTDFVKTHRLTETMTPASMTYYSEYPRGSGRYWSVPLESDAIGWAYRRDWFEDAQEMASFQTRYGYALAPPQTWQQLRDIAEFFYRPGAKPPRYGVALYTETTADGLAMGYTTALYSYGGALGDYATCAVDGVVNAPTAIEALEAYKELYGFMPPGWSNAASTENNLAITANLAAMSMNYFAFFPSLINPAVNPNATVTGFFVNPAGPTGERYSALGGQGISVVAYSRKQQAALRFLEWLVREDTQQKWADFGGYTADAAILKSAKFRNATPYNEAFFESMFVVKDFWAEPYYAELLDQMNRRLGPFMGSDTVSAKDALDGLASDWTATIAKRGC